MTAPARGCRPWEPTKATGREVGRESGPQGVASITNAAGESPKDRIPEPADQYVTRQELCAVELFKSLLRDVAVSLFLKIAATDVAGLD